MTKKLLFLAITLTLVCTAATTHKCVKLTDVQALTLKKGALTTGRRSSPVLQLQCSGSFCKHAPDSVQCINVGPDGNNVQWKCQANLPDWLSFKDSDSNVSCEGYEYPTDPYILAGSCGMSYSLAGSPPWYGPDSTPRTRAGSAAAILLVILAELIFLGALLRCCRNSRGHYTDGGGSNAASAAAGAAVGYAAGRAGGGYHRPWGGGGSRRRHRGGGWGSTSSAGGLRTATTFSGTCRR